jgi:hypothetical protein
MGAATFASGLGNVLRIAALRPVKSDSHHFLRRVLQRKFARHEADQGCVGIEITRPAAAGLPMNG